MSMVPQSALVRHRKARLRKKLWGEQRSWSTGQTGFFMAPRTLPLILTLLNEKTFSGKNNVSRVYLELFASHREEGLVEIRNEDDHAFAAGFRGGRARRSWQERIAILESQGFIRVEPKGNQKYGYILLLHPTDVIKRLLDEGKIDDRAWIRAYEACLVDAGLDHDAETVQDELSTEGT